MNSPVLFADRRFGTRLLISGMLPLLAALAGGCTEPLMFKTAEARKPDAVRADNAAEQLPAWTFDSPEYMRPAAELAPAPRSGSDEAQHFYTNRRPVSIIKPTSYDTEQLPRVAVWWSTDGGAPWRRAGFFGQGQSHFWFEPPGDGDFGIRFSLVNSPNDPAPSGAPHRVYHVDTVQPVVQLMVEPNAPAFAPGQEVHLRWRTQDAFLADGPVTVEATTAAGAEKPTWTVIAQSADAEGSVSYPLPAEVGPAGVTLRVTARDRAGNAGVAFTPVFRVSPDRIAARTTTAGDESPTLFDDDEPIASAVEPHAIAATGLGGPVVSPPAGMAAVEAAIDRETADLSLAIDPTIDDSAVNASDLDTGRVSAVAGFAPPEVQPAPAAAPSSGDLAQALEAEVLFENSSVSGAAPTSDVTSPHSLTASNGLSDFSALDSDVPVAAPPPPTRLSAPLAPSARPRAATSLLTDSSSSDVFVPPADVASAIVEEVAPVAEGAPAAPPAAPGVSGSSLVAPLPATSGVMSPSAMPAAPRWMTLEPGGSNATGAIWSLPQPQFNPDDHALFEKPAPAASPGKPAILRKAAGEFDRDWPLESE